MVKRVTTDQLNMLRLYGRRIMLIKYVNLSQFSSDLQNELQDCVTCYMLQD